MISQIIFLVGLVAISVSVKIDLVDEEGLDAASILDHLFVNNHEDINEYLDLSEYRPNKTYEEMLQEYEHVGMSPYSSPDEPEESIPEKIRQHGYPCEVHSVTTQDGYILELHRIPDSPNAPRSERKQPVFLMHGLLDSSSTWVLMGPENALAYMLADLGYDVWMGNARGNRYSRRHVQFNPDGRNRERRQFWSFGWHEIGTIDLPTMIDFVLEQTGFEKLHYIGHSQGTTSFFVMTSERPEYNSKILLMNALAPIAYMTNLRSPIGRSLATLLSRTEGILNLIGQFEFLPGDDILTSSAAQMCKQKVIAKHMCQNILFLAGGFNSELFDESAFPLILKYTPAGAATRQITHYGQLMQTRHFRRYDFGLRGNLRAYRSLIPPLYPLNRITAPVALHYGQNDLLAAVSDVQRLGAELGNVAGLFPVPHPRFNHFDFVWARNVRTLLYNRVVQLMRAQEELELFGAEN